MGTLPILCMKKAMAEQLGKSIREVVRAQVHDEESGSGRCMRIRVRVDITKPLSQGRRIGLANGDEGWVSFQYERLPNFCYWCGIPTQGKRIVKIGSRPGMLRKKRHRNMGYSLEYPKNESFAECKLRWRGGFAVQVP